MYLRRPALGTFMSPGLAALGTFLSSRAGVSPSPLGTDFDWVGAGPWGFGDLGRGLTIHIIAFIHLSQK